MRKLLALLLLLPLLAHGGTINGNIQTSSSGAVVNGTLTFSLNQVAVVSGSAQVVATPVNCYTSAAGAIVNEPDPQVAPVLSVNLASGTLAAGTYFVKFTYFDASGESLPSPESSITLVSPGTVIVAPPAVQPANATGWRVYISATTGSETRQSSLTGFAANYSQTASLSAGAALPGSNTSACSFRFTDELIPSTTYYTVNLVNSGGSKIAGYPISQARFYGGSSATVNVSTGWPVSIGGVIWPTPIVSTPNANAGQSISGPLTATNFIGNMNGVAQATSASNIQAAINAACTGGNPGIAFMPLGLTTNVPPLTYGNNCSISCVARRGCKLQLANGANADLFTPANPAATNSNVSITNLVLDGNTTNQTGTSRCIYTKNMTNFHVEDNDILNCRSHGVQVDDGSDQIYIGNNAIHTVTIGDGVQIGNAPLLATVTNFHIFRNQIDGTFADAIFTLGSKSAGVVGTGPGEISLNVIPNAGDTCIEVGDSSHDVMVTGNFCGIVSANRTGITARSAQRVTYTGNVVTCLTPGATQVAFQFWNQNGDNVPFADIGVTNNIAIGCSGSGGTGFAWTSFSGSSDGLKIRDNLALGNTVNFSPLTTNITHLDRCNNSDGICDTSTVPVFQKNGGPSIWVRDTAQSITAGGLYRLTSSGANFQIDMNTAAGGDFSSITTPFQIDSSGNIIFGQNKAVFAGLAGFDVRNGLTSRWCADNCATIKLVIDASSGKDTTYAGVATADFGLMAIVGTPQHVTGQTANIANTNLVASAPVGTYEVHVDCRTTTSGTGTTASFSVLWTDEGGAKTTTSSTWALNAVNSTGQVNSITVLHAVAASAIQYSVTGTFGTSVYACDAWATRTQ